MTLQLGILLALLCAVASNLGFFFKHRGACACAKVEIRHPFRSARALWTSRWLAVGTIGGGGVVLTPVMAARMFGFCVGRRQWWGFGLTAVGLVLLAVPMPNPSGAHAT